MSTPQTTVVSDQPFENEWAVVELMGHTRLGARISEAKLAGGTFLRLDVHPLTGPAEVTQLVPPPPGGPIYRITMTTEQIARTLGARYLAASPPVARWELPALAASADDSEAADGDGDLGGYYFGADRGDEEAF